MKRSSILVGLLALGACSSVPSISGEPVEIFPVAPDAPQQWAVAGVSGAAPTGDWLGQFNDPVMYNLVVEALESNPSIRSQYYAVEATRATARSTYGRSLPNVSLGASATARSSYVEVTDSRVDTTTVGLGPDLSWEVDLWGRLSAGIEAAEADLAASEADLAAARLAHQIGGLRGDLAEGGRIRSLNHGRDKPPV